MLLFRVQFVLLITLLQTCDAFHRSPPANSALLLPQGQSRANSVLAKRADNCGDGTQCRSGYCCGTGCSSNCCAHDDGGLACGDAERCEFTGNVFIGCCPISAVQGCTGTATSVYVTSPYSTIILATDVPFTSAHYTPTYEDSTTSDISFPTYTRPSDYRTRTASQEYIPTATSIAYDDGESGSRGKLSIGAKAGIGVGASLGGLALAAVAGFFFKRNKNKKGDPTSAVVYTTAPPAPMYEDKGQEMSGKEANVPAYPSHGSELSGAPETRRYEMPG